MIFWPVLVPARMQGSIELKLREDFTCKGLHVQLQGTWVFHGRTLILGRNLSRHGCLTTDLS